MTKRSFFVIVYSATNIPELSSWVASFAHIHRVEPTGDVVIVLLVVVGAVYGLLYLAVQAAKYFIGYFMPKTADRVDAWREESFVQRTAQAIVDGQGYTAWEIERHVERHAPKLLPRPEHETTYGTMKGHPEALEFDRIAAAERHARIVAAVNARTREGLANRGV